MHRYVCFSRALLTLVALTMFASCARVGSPEQEEEAAESRLRFEVSRSERRLHVYRDDELIRSHDVAVGQPEWPTPTGEWRIFRVDWNPDWTPPEGEWAEDDTYQPPGAPGNPMGRARLVYNPPYAIHGTEELESLGQAASHGSIRVANEVAIELGRLLMEEGGAPRDESWHQEVLDNPTDMRQIDLPNPVPIRVRD